jgi:cell fate regulator YaaT (PSP1 superfamily)
MKIAKQISTGEYINDFQDKATEEVLISNAIKNGIAKEDIEILEVEKEQYDAIVNEYFRADREALALDIATNKSKYDLIVADIKVRNEMSEEEFKKFKDYILTI